MIGKRFTHEDLKSMTLPVVVAITRADYQNLWATVWLEGVDEDCVVFGSHDRPPHIYLIVGVQGDRFIDGSGKEMYIHEFTE